MDYYPQLLQCQLFKGLTYSQIEKVIMSLSGTVNSYRKNDLIVRTGDYITGIMVVLEGSVSVSHTGNYNNDGIVETIEKSQIFGTAYALGNQPLLVTAKAVSPTSILFLRCDNLPLQIAQSEDGNLALFTSNLLCSISNKVILLATKLEYMHLPTIKSKLASYLFNHYYSTNSNSFYLPMSRTSLAEYLGVSRSSMLREMSQIKKSGIISILEDGMIVINSISDLEMII